MSRLEKCSIEFDGVFDSQAAGKVDEALGAMQPGGALKLDLTHVREFNNVGLALLARTLKRTRESMRVDVRGLGRRQHCLLRYFGVELATEAPLVDDSLA